MVEWWLMREKPPTVFWCKSAHARALKMYAAIGRSYATAGLIFMVESQKGLAEISDFSNSIQFTI
jgi:hypothetical protein